MVRVAVGHKRFLRFDVERDLRHPAEMIFRAAVRGLPRHADLLQELSIVRELEDVRIRTLADGRVAGPIPAYPDIPLVIHRDAVIRRGPDI